MDEDPAPDYCPFCGARLRAEEGALRTHLGNHEDCRERYEAWGDDWFRAATVGNDPGARRAGLARTVLVWVVIVAVVGYALLVAQQVLLGVVAAAAVYVAFAWAGSRGVR